MTLETIKSPETTPTDDIDHLINHLAVIVRATKPEYGLTEEQKKACYDRFSLIYDKYPKEMLTRVLGAVDNKDPFWVPHSDTVLKHLNEAGILVDSLGI